MENNMSELVLSPFGKWCKRELKPCPFCGKDPIIDYAVHDYNLWAVRCRNCNAMIEVDEWNGTPNTMESAIEKWNRREGTNKGVDE